MIKCIVPPLARGDTRTIGGQNVAEFGSRKIKLATKPFRAGNTRHVLDCPAFLLAVLILHVYVGTIFGCRQLTVVANLTGLAWQTNDCAMTACRCSDQTQPDQGCRTGHREINYRIRCDDRMPRADTRADTKDRDVGRWLIFLMKSMKS